MAGIEVVADRVTKASFRPEVGAARVLERNCLAEGLIVRALGETVGLAPPLIISHDEIRDLGERLARAVAVTERQLLA
jgi:4-aminobutyrate--pyruvate transaminase